MGCACLAAWGPWITGSHTEWGGGESIAKLISGSKLWVIATTATAAKQLHRISTFAGMSDFLNRQRENTMKRREQLMYHLGQPGDVIVQPAFATDFVVTDETMTEDGELLLALVTGFEGLDNRVLNRGVRLCDDFITGFGRCLVKIEVTHLGFAYFLRLLKVRDCRRSLSDFNPDQGGSLEDSRKESDITTHFHKNGYDLLRSLGEKHERRPTAKKARIANLRRDACSSADFKSSIAEITDLELRTWPQLWNDDINLSSLRRL